MFDLPSPELLDTIAYAQLYKKVSTSGIRKRVGVELEIIYAAENLTGFMARLQDHSPERIPYDLPAPQTA